MYAFGQMEFFIYRKAWVDTEHHMVLNASAFNKRSLN